MPETHKSVNLLARLLFPTPIDAKTTKNIHSTIVQETSAIFPADIIFTDGLSFSTWEKRIFILLDNYIDDSHHFKCSSTASPTNEKVSFKAFLQSFPPSTQPNVIEMS
ncbi:hypothetical protein O181_004238 [Austropuccinia psidii MF-1]|uniref:Uncharacterized protein n=1 Tax=Austropuccinia psidii MF-1 TaxID=1389203 RepID=A0A9Q3BFZ0_9BASI|nr:hypothetical protein [Austropuccinia psidii MF-1]